MALNPDGHSPQSKQTLINRSLGSYRPSSIQAADQTSAILRMSQGMQHGLSPRHQRQMTLPQQGSQMMASAVSKGTHATKQFAPAVAPSHGQRQLQRVHATAVESPPASSPAGLHSSIVAAKPVQVPKPRSGPILGPELGELHKRFKKLQNGSDVRGIALDGIPNEPLSLSSGAVFFIGVAFARWLRSKQPEGAIRVSVGRDCRLSGALIESSLAAGLASEGVDVTLFGMATTPCMFYSIVEKSGNYTGAIMITASHMPWNANGMKFFVESGGLEKTDISALIQIASQACGEAGLMLGEPWSEATHVMKASRTLKGTVTQHDFRPIYARFLRGLIIQGVGSKDAPNLPLLGCKMVVDAGNGAGGFFATEVLAPLGADITGSRYLDPDGSFPNHPSNPEHPAAMASGAQAVLESGAELGIVFDTDVDRSAIVDRNGREINSNKFIALMSAIVLRDYPGTTIVTDSVTSTGLAKFIEELGGKHIRFKRGYKNVIGKGIQLNQQGVETHLMMETSGHGAIKENYYLDDGAFMAVQVVIEAVRRKLAGGGDISELLAALPEPLEAKEVRVRITDPEFSPIGKKVIDSFHEWLVSSAPAGWTLDPINHEGWRVNVEEGDGKVGWVLLRQSLHDPLLVINVESEVKGGAQATLRKVLDFLLQKCQGMPLDLSTLKN